MAGSDNRRMGGYIGADILSALSISKTVSGALGTFDTSRLARESMAGMQIGKMIEPLATKEIAPAFKSADLVASSLKAFDTRDLMKDAVASMRIGHTFSPTDTKGRASVLSLSETVSEILGNLDTTRMVRDSMASMKIGKTFDPPEIRGIVPALKSSDLVADSLKAFDTQRLMKDAVASMQLGAAFNPGRAKSVAEMLGAGVAGVGALGSRDAFEGFFQTDLDDDPEASFVRALIGSWFLQLPLGARVGLVLAALDLLLNSADWLEAAGAVDPPEPAFRMISTAVALVSFALALQSARASSSES
jgi:hypothetical protein